MISAIVLAAGYSRRMKKENKLIKKFKNKHLINHIITTLLKSKINKIIIILGFQSLKIKKIIKNNKKITFSYNKKYKSGVASSIKVGLKKITKKNFGFLIIQGDMPLISKNIINSLVNIIKKSDKEIFIPINRNRMGNPVGFKTSMVKNLFKIKGDIGAKNIIKKNKKKIYLIKTSSKSIFKDFNTQKDFL